MASPYDKLDETQWKAKTQQLIDEHPLDTKEIRKIVQNCWDCIFNTTIGDYKVGTDIFPKPQIIGFFLHELICLEICKIDSETWTCEKNTNDKDVVNKTNELYSIEIKTSSNKSKIFGNRSYAQKTDKSKKSKSGYYLAINFQSFKLDKDPRIVKVRFGWLDHKDWIGQETQSGQKSTLGPDVEKYKLLEI